MNPNPNIFTDPESPFATAPERVKQILLLSKQDEELNTDAIDLDKLGFEPKPTGNNFCSHFFEQDQQYYICKNCSTSEISFCSSCWESQKHVGHDYQAMTPQSDGCCCDCGRIQKMKKQSICSNHSAYDVIKQCEIPQKDANQFKQTLQSLLQCAIYQKVDETWLGKILSFLINMNENSIFYNRLTFDVVVKKSKFIETQNVEDAYTFLLVLSKCGDEFIKFIFHMCGDLLTRKNLVKYICGLYNIIDYNVLGFFHEGVLMELINLTTIQKLLQQNFDHKLFDMTIPKIQQTYSIRTPNKIVLLKMKDLQNLRYLNGLNLAQLSRKETQGILVKIVGLYPSSQDIGKLTGEQQSYSQSSSKWQKNTKEANQWILKFIYMLTKGDIERFNKIRQILYQAGIKPEKLEQILHWIVKSANKICYQDDEPSKLVFTIVLIKLLKQSKNSKQLLERFWNFLLKNPKNKEQHQNDGNSTEIDYLADIFHSMISTLLHSEISLLMEKMRIQKQQKNNSAKIESASEEQTLANWFKSYLCERKTIPREQIIKLKSDGFLKFKNVREILNQICTYDYSKQIFTYPRSKAEKNITNQFPFYPIKENYESIYTNTLYFGQKINFEGQSSKDLIQFLLQAENILPVFDKKWEEYLKSKSKNDGKHKYAYLYLFVLVLYDCLTKGENKQLRQRLQFLRQNKQKLSEYTKDQDEIKLIYRLLNIQKVQNKISEETSVQHPIQQPKTKSNLSLNLKKLPENAQQCSKLFPKKCNNCQNNCKFFCLMCGQILCQECRDVHSSQAHDGTTIYLQEYTLAIHCNRKNYHSSDQLYFNECKVGYKDRNYYSMGADEYLLSKSQYQKVINKFLSN